MYVLRYVRRSMKPSGFRHDGNRAVFIVKPFVGFHDEPNNAYILGQSVVPDMRSAAAVTSTLPGVLFGGSSVGRDSTYRQWVREALR